MMLIMETTLGKLIAARLHPNTNLKAKDLAERIGRSASYLSQLVNDQKQETPPPDVMAALERELGIPQATMLRLWGYDLPVSPRPELEDNRLQMVADNWEPLTEIEKLMVLKVIEGNRRARGFDGLEDIVQVVTESVIARRASG